MTDIQLPPKPARSRFAILAGLGAIVLTAICWWTVGFSPLDLYRNLGRNNPVARGLVNLKWDEMFSQRSRNAFLETLQLAVLGTAGGALVSLPLALFATEVGNPFRVVRGIVRVFNSVVRAIPDLMWAGLFVLGVGIGKLSGLLALFFFSIAVITKLLSDTVDGIDMGPVEAARAAGASQIQVLRTAVVPQILPAFASFTLYDFEINLRASAILGFVGAGGIGLTLNYFKTEGKWDRLWGLVVMFFIVVFLIERLSVSIRRRLL